MSSSYLSRSVTPSTATSWTVSFWFKITNINPSSGTPFVDHHSTFLSLMGVYFILLSIKKNTKSLNYFIPVFFILAFFSKQVPSSYFFISVIPIYIIYLVVNKKFNFIFTFNRNAIDDWVSQKLWHQFVELHSSRRNFLFVT